MPYIIQDRRDHIITFTGTEFADTSGELNYLLTQVVLTYLDRKGKSYQTINDIIGALEGAKLEFYRRVAAPYEDKKIQENGDVY
mgnify:CR=1 FL=1